VRICADFARVVKRFNFVVLIEVKGGWVVIGLKWVERVSYIVVKSSLN
jgi:hypothetical protein